MTVTYRPQTSRFGWLPLALLLILGLLPVLAAVGRMVMRFADIGATPEMVADSSRFYSMPTVVILHLVGGSVFTVLGALQFSGTLRRGSWHRITGRVLVVAGLTAALSSLWLTNFYPHLPTDGPLIYWFRMVAGLGMLWLLVRGFQTARQSRFDKHRPHMMRAYALGLGAATQMLVGIPYVLLFGQPEPITSDLLLGISWVINLGVAQWVLKRRGGSSGPGNRLSPNYRSAGPAMRTNELPARLEKLNQLPLLQNRIQLVR